MTKINFIILFSTLLILSCSENDATKKEQLFGEWSKVDAELHAAIPPLHYRPFGIGFTEDKIEFFNGCFKIGNQDSISRKPQLTYKGTFANYEVRLDSIFVRNPFSEKWKFAWKIKKQLNDTLILAKNDTNILKLQRIKTKTTINFDQIILSSSGCYGSCPIIDISIDNKNKVYFQGERYVNPLGIYAATIDSASTNYIFSKFGKANIDSLLNQYQVEHTDDESITTTFIKNDKIIKTIHDYGRASTKKLIWAYVPIQNLHSQIKLDSLPNDEHFYPKLHYYTFERDSQILKLEKSESFFLWTEMKNFKVVNKAFKPKYSVGYWRTNSSKDKEYPYKIDGIESDGRLFKFSYKGQKSITYDLGYNFIERNFKETDFKKKTE